MRRTALFVLLLIFTTGRSRTEPPPALSLAEALRMARQNNPEIQAARLRWEAAQNRTVQDATPEKPRLDIERMYAPRNESPISGAQERNWTVTQELPFPSALYLKGRRARQQAASAEAAYQAKEADVLSRVQKAWAMAYAARHAIHLYEDNADLMRQMAKAAESRYASGLAPQTDVLKAQTELSRMLNMLVTLQQDQQTAQGMLNSLLNRPLHTRVDVSEEPEVAPILPSEDALQAMALENRPELRREQAAFEAVRTSLALARSDYLPDLMLGYRRRDMAEGLDSHDALLGVSLPLWFWKQNAMVREAAAERAMAEAELQSMKTMTLYDVQSLLVRVQTAQRLVELYRTSVLPQAQQALKIAQAGYQSGRISFLDLLDASRTLLNFRLEHYGHIADYVQYRADLERVIGAPLKEEPRHE